MSGKPLLLGHRGCRGRSSAVLPVENSLAAFEYALTNGCDGFEFDVRHTRDGRNVLWHDAKWHGMEIAATDYADLTDRNNACLPLLEEALQRFGSRAYLDIELKVPGNEQSVIAAVNVHHPASWIYPLDVLSRNTRQASRTGPFSAPGIHLRP